MQLSSVWKAAGKAVLTTSFAAASFSASAAIEIQWWHAMGGALGERVNEIAENYNLSQDAYKVVPVFKGNYGETMTAGIAAYRAKKAPHILGRRRRPRAG